VIKIPNKYVNVNVNVRCKQCKCTARCTACRFGILPT